MDQLVAYSDEEDGTTSNGVRAVAKEQRKEERTSEASVKVTPDPTADRPPAAHDEPPDPPTGGDLQWLRPPAKRIRNVIDGSIVTDAEWGLGNEKRSNDDNDEEGGQPVDPALEAKLAHFHQLKAQGTHFNESLARNRSFRNPHIYAKLVEWVEVDETASAFDGMVRGGAHEADRAWRASSTARREMLREGGAERLAALQKKRQEEADEAKARGRRSNIDFVASSPLDTATALARERANTIRRDLSARNSTSQHQRGSGSSSGSRRRDWHDADSSHSSKRHPDDRERLRDSERYADLRTSSHKSHNHRS